MGAPAPAVSPLDLPCPVEWQGESLEDALAQLAGRLGIPYVIDPSIPVETLDTPVRFFATHLTAQQALRWAARYAGLEAVFVDGTLLVAPPDRLPRLWREPGLAATQGFAGVPSPRPALTWEAVRGRRADIAWIDSPLGRVARDLARAYQVDAIFHPALVRDQPLVHVERSDMDLAALRDALASQLNCTAVFLDGVLWFAPAGGHATTAAAGAASRPAGPSTPTADARASLSRPLTLPDDVKDWAALGRFVEKVTGVICQIDAARGLARPEVRAEGPLVDILDAGQLLQIWSWEPLPQAAEGAPRIAIWVRPREPGQP